MSINHAHCTFCHNSILPTNDVDIFVLTTKVNSLGEHKTKPDTQ